MAAPTYFFTEPDPDLTASSSRDPLGFEILWTQLGGRVVPHFSTISVGATNFGVCLALVWLVDSYLEEREGFVFSDGEQWRGARDGLLIVAEALHAYAALKMRGEREGVFGGQKAARRLKNLEDPRVGPFDSESLLVRQLQFGVYGRYRRALSSMGLLDDTGHLEEPDLVSATIRASAELKGLQGAVYDFFDRIREADGHRLGLSDFGGLEQMAALRGKEVRRHFAPRLTRAAGLTEDSDDLIAHVYHETDLPYRGASHARDILYRLTDSESLADLQRQRVLDVCRCEELLLRFEALFDHLWAGSVQSDACQPLISSIRERRGDLEVLASRSALSDIAAQRLKTLAEVADERSPTDFCRALVETYHRDTIADYRGNAGWITFEGDRPVVINSGHSPSGDPLTDAGWSRNYYLRSLAAFKADIEEVS